jgi:hypothetical protein
MRGTNNRRAFDYFWEGAKLRGMPLTLAIWERSDKLFRQAIEEDTGLGFEEARKKRTGFPRAWSWKAYGITMSYFLGREGSKESLIGEALDLVGISLEGDKFDYQNHWVAAFIHLVAGNIDRVEGHKREALALNAEDQNTGVMNEMADVLVWLGRPDEALKLLERTRHIGDWNRWSVAWAFYAKAKDDPIFYDWALREIGRTFGRPGDQNYEFDIDLLTAVIRVQKAEIFERQGDKENAEKQRELANLARGRFLAENARQGWRQSDERRRMPFAANDDAAQALQRHWLDGVAKLGLPD